MDPLDQDERHVRAYHARYSPAHLLSPDRSRRATPRELVRVLLRGITSPEYVHAMVRQDLPADIR